jgi:hypothetical protein
VSPQLAAALGRVAASLTIRRGSASRKMKAISGSPSDSQTGTAMAPSCQQA